MNSIFTNLPKFNFWNINLKKNSFFKFLKNAKKKNKLFFKKLIFWIILFIHGLTPKSNSNSIPTLGSMSKLKLKSKFRFSFKFNFKLRFKFRFKFEFKLNSKFNFNSYSNSKSWFRMRPMGIVRVTNVHSNFNQFLFKFE